MRGFYKKYIVTKTSGNPMDPEAEFIVLRIDKGIYLHACRAGAAAFAEAVRGENPLLANGIQTRLEELIPWGGFKKT